MQHDTRWIYRSGAILLFVLLMGATVVGTVAVRSHVRSLVEEEFDEAVAIAMAGAEDGIEATLNQLRVIQDLYNASEFVTRDEFNTFVKRFVDQSSEVQAMEWIASVPAIEGKAFIRDLQQQTGFENFNIHPETDDQEHYLVTYVFPIEGNEKAFGFDLRSETNRRTAAERARDTGQLQATDPITLVQETGTQAAFLVYAPIYSTKNVPATVEQRREALQGFGLAVFRFGDFLDGVLPAIVTAGLDVVVFHHNSPKGADPIYSTAPLSVELFDGDLMTVVAKLPVVGEEWTFHFFAPRGFGISTLAGNLWWLILLAGAILSTFVLASAYMLLKAREAALVLADERRRSEESIQAVATELEQLIQTANTQIIGVDLDGNIDIWNQASEDMFGYPVAEATGMDLLQQFVFGDDRDHVRDVIGTVLTGKLVGDTECRMVSRSGELIDILANTTPRKNVNGDVIGVLAVCVNITDRKIAEASQRAIAEELALLIETANTPIIGVDNEGRVNEWNGSIEQLTGFTKADAIGRPFAEFVPESHQSEMVSRMGQALIGEPIFDFEFPVLTKQDGQVDLLMNGTARRDNQGNIVGAVGVALDITARKKADLEIRQLNETLELRVEERTQQLEAAISELEAFSYSVSHDLRSPLRSIDGFSLAIVEDYEDKLDDAGRDMLGRIRSATQRMGNLIDDLLALSRVTRTEMHVEPISLTSIAEEIAFEFQSSQPDRTIDVVIEEEVTAHGDERLMRIVLENLMRNAWKFTSHHDAARIEFGTVKVDGTTAYVVRDDGVGFDMEYADKLFTPFQRLHAASEFEGSGIGLAIIKRIINRHGGRVWTQAEVEKGAAFYFTLGSSGGGSGDNK